MKRAEEERSAFWDGRRHVEALKKIALLSGQLHLFSISPTERKQ